MTDLRVAFRQLAARPGCTVVAAMALPLGTGAGGSILGSPINALRHE